MHKSTRHKTHSYKQPHTKNAQINVRNNYKLHSNTQLHITKLTTYTQRHIKKQNTHTHTLHKTHIKKILKHPDLHTLTHYKTHIIAY